MLYIPRSLLLSPFFYDPACAVEPIRSFPDFHWLDFRVGRGLDYGAEDGG